jgi:hypothetical protein
MFSVVRCIHLLSRAVLVSPARFAVVLIVGISRAPVILSV